jgi:hypothetical protein
MICFEADRNRRRIVRLGSTGRRPVISDGSPETDRRTWRPKTGKFRLASLQTVQASGLRSPDEEPIC